MPPRDAEPHFLEPLLGVVFDLDGTLVLSHHDFGRMRAEVIRVAEKYGVVPGHLSVNEPIHRIVEAARQELVNSGGPEGNLFRFEAEYPKRVDAIEAEALPRTVARPGAESLLRALAERGFRLGVLTRSSEYFARNALARTALGPFFPYLRSRSAPGPQKPSPEALHLLLREMEIPGERALFVGDHLIDAGVRDPRRRAVLRRVAGPVRPEPGTDDRGPVPRRRRGRGRERPSRAGPPPRRGRARPPDTRRLTRAQRYSA